MRNLLTASLLLAALAPRAVAADDRHVVVISVDGLPGYLLDDPQASLPVIRGLAARGAVSKAGMGVSNPSVTWPNHTTLMTGLRPETHGVLFNGLPERHGVGKPATVTPGKGQRDLVRVPLLFDVLKDAGKTSAAINWPCTRESASIDDNFPDVPDQLNYTTPRLKETLNASDRLKDFDGGNAVVRDEVWADAACRTIREHKPSLLVLHLLNVDGTHHRFGPKSPPGYTAVALADAMVGRVLDAVDDAGLRESTTVFVVSDHGFAKVTKSLRPNALLRKAGLLEADDRGRVTSARAHVISEGGIGMVYLTDPSTAAADGEAVRKAFAGVEGVAAVVGPDDFSKYGLPAPADHAGMADLIIACESGYAVDASAAGDAAVVAQENPTGSHGYLSTDPLMRATFVASGAGVKRGVTLDAVENVDVAPTVARVLGVTLPKPAGRALAEILESGR